MHHTVASETLSSATSDFVNSASERQAPVARTGCISGASSIAPMTTAAELRASPMTATITDRLSMVTNRQAQWSTLVTARSAMIRRRSSGSRLRCHQAGRRRKGPRPLASCSVSEVSLTVTPRV